MTDRIRPDKSLGSPPVATVNAVRLAAAAEAHLNAIGVPVLITEANAVAVRDAATALIAAFGPTAQPGSLANLLRPQP